MLHVVLLCKAVIAVTDFDVPFIMELSLVGSAE